MVFSGTFYRAIVVVWATAVIRVLTIDVSPSISCSLLNNEYLDISSLECMQCDDARYDVAAHR